MDAMKKWVAAGVAGCLAVLALGWAGLVSPRRSEAAELVEAAQAQEAGNAALRNQLAVLKAQAKELPKQQAKLAAVAAKLPASKQMPALIRALSTAAEETGVELVSLTPGKAVLAQVAAAPAAVAPVAGNAAAAAVAAPGTPPTVPNAGAAPTAAGRQLAVIPLTLNVVGGYFQVQQFLAQVEELTRAVRMTNVSVAPGLNPVAPAAPAGSASTTLDGSSLSATLVGEVYMTVPAPVATTTPVVPGSTGASAPAAN